MNETKTTWAKCNTSGKPSLRIVSSEDSLSYSRFSVSDRAARTAIANLVEELTKVEGLKRFKAIATYFPDIHWIDFEIELENYTQLSDEAWNKIQDIVIDCEWKLIDDSTEDWYFRPRIVDKSYLFGDEVIADSDNTQHKSDRRLKISSSPSRNFVVIK